MIALLFNGAIVYAFIPAGHGIPPLLKAITKLLPLDTYVPAPVSKDYVCV